MIAVSVNKDRFFYDIHSLVKAFYPEEEVACFVRGTKDVRSSEGSIALSVDLAEEKGEIFVSLSQGREGWSVPEGTKGIKEEKIQTGFGLTGTDIISESITCLPEKDGGRTSSIDLSPVFDERGERLYNAKNALKRLLYRMLSGQTGKQLPWGSLTGIRPTHIPATLLQAGRDDATILKELADTYHVSSEKAALALEIAKREREVLSGDAFADGYSLYAGIPFCPTTCLYCSFPSYPAGAWADRIDAYLDALIRELRAVSELFQGRRLCTVYIGGGTPTTLSPAQSDRLLTAIETLFDLSHVREITVEAGRPDSVTEEKLQTLKAHGVTRLSINPQTMQQRTLDLIGRRHSVDDVVRAFALARSFGCFSINMDLILGLPGENAADVSETMDRIEALAPDDLTLHALAVKRGSRMQALLESGKASFPAFRDIEAATELAQKRARGMGLKPYYLYRQKNIAGNFENTGYAREDAIGLYNILINSDVHSIAACGAGAVSKRVSGDAVNRAENVRELTQYLDRIDEMIDRKVILYS
ncbi:MAG: coproporphyrinogen dehydrogenase HemZ [Lachnospiraceae bacterium]|nr:coproporphyrinogen dehydrogenase HemZ [Lachnospiraceae bacterium]